MIVPQKKFFIIKHNNLTKGACIRHSVWEVDKILFETEKIIISIHPFFITQKQKIKEISNFSIVL